MTQQLSKLGLDCPMESARKVVECEEPWNVLSVAVA